MRFLKILLILGLVPAVVAPLKGSTGQDSITVYLFLLESCPISKSITLELKELYKEFHNKGITFVGLFPNTGWSKDSSIQEFGKTYQLPLELKLDENQAFTKQFSATVTPEVVVVRNHDQRVLYRGKVDNSFESVGKRRQSVTHRYLYNALQSILQHRPVAPSETKPVGCFILSRTIN